MWRRQRRSLNGSLSDDRRTEFFAVSRRAYFPFAFGLSLNKQLDPIFLGGFGEVFIGIQVKSAAHARVSSFEVYPVRAGVFNGIEDEIIRAISLA